ncbi:hypothetical protein GGS24DRAFT_36831 [Hypoxylon argillaceum]|nr:hypothetical protein GGS24DRAFT_36831 [Hypoxylon argillaceum]
MTALSNLGPLPTTFAVASTCAQDLDGVYKIFTVSPGYYYLLQGPVDQTSCYPSGYNGVSTQYYSPARCPTGFTSACQSINAAGTVSETVIRCCPTQSSFICQTTASYIWESTLGCSAMGDSPRTSTEWTVTQVTDGLTSVVTSSGLIGGVNAYGIKVGFQSTDFASSTTTKKTTTKTTTSSPSTTTTHAGTSSSSSSSSTSRKKKSKVSSGAIAGIVIGALAGLAALASFIWLLIRRRGGKPEDGAPAQAEREAEKHELGTGNEGAAELDGGGVVPPSAHGSPHVSPQSQPPSVYDYYSQSKAPSAYSSPHSQPSYLAPETAASQRVG